MDRCPQCRKNSPYFARYNSKRIYITECCDACWTQIKKRYRQEDLKNPEYVCDEPIKPKEMSIEAADSCYRRIEGGW